jgi:hypothetical protein
MLGSNLTSIWQHVPQQFQELNELEFYADESQLNTIYTLRDKISRCSNLKQKLAE